MSTTAGHQVTGSLGAWGKGERAALDALIPHVYRELKRLARRRMQAGDAGTLYTTAVVHEAYLRLVDMSSVTWQDRAHFYAVSARIIRGILVDAARARQARVVELRFFVGLSVEETTEVLKVSPQSVMRDSKLARARLRREVRGDGARDRGAE